MLCSIASHPPPDIDPYHDPSEMTATKLESRFTKLTKPQQGIFMGGMGSGTSILQCQTWRIQSDYMWILKSLVENHHSREAANSSSEPVVAVAAKLTPEPVVALSAQVPTTPQVRPALPYIDFSSPTLTK